MECTYVTELLMINPDLCVVICCNCRVKVTKLIYLALSIVGITVVTFDITAVFFDTTVVFLLG
jgi:hypothetical protein